MTINVSLADVAAFAKEVKTPHLFDVLSGFCRVVDQGSEVVITISTKHWQRVNQKGHQEETLEEMSHLLKRIDRKTGTFESVLEDSHKILQSQDAPKTPMQPLAKEGT